jgi:hypothetical protein
MSMPSRLWAFGVCVRSAMVSGGGILKQTAADEKPAHAYRTCALPSDSMVAPRRIAQRLINSRMRLPLLVFAFDVLACVIRH